LQIKFNRLNINFLLISFLPLILFLTSSHVFILDYFHLRNFFYILLLFWILLIITINRSNFNGDILRLFIILTISNIISALLYSNDRLLFSNILSFLVIVSFCTFDRNQLIQFIVSLNFLNSIFSTLALLSLLFFILGISIISILNGLNGDIYILNFISRFDSFIDISSIYKIPRVTSYLDQASLLSAYFLLPLSLYLIVGGKNRYIYLPILIFCLSSLSGSFYFSILIFILIVIFKDLLSFRFLLFLPIFFLILELILGSRLFYSFTILLVNNFNLISFDFFIPRISSGLRRLYILTSLYDEIFSNIFINTNTVLNGKFGSIFFTYSLRSGVLGFFCSVYLYILIQFNIIKNIINPTNQNIGFILLYSCIFQSFVFNDYGFSSFIGTSLFAISLKILYEFSPKADLF